MPANTYTLSGFIFTGWSVSGTGATAGVYNAGVSVAVSALSTAIASRDASITLTAKWMEEILTLLHGIQATAVLEAELQQKN